MPRASVLELRGLLEEELAPVPVRVRRALALLVAAAGAAGAWAAVRAADDGTAVVAKGPPTFTFRRADALRSVPPRGEELVRFERREGGLLLAAVAVEPFTVPARSGSAAAALRTLAGREALGLRRRFPGLRLVDGQRTRLNDVTGYTMVFRARRHPRLLGRVLLLPEPVPGSPRGVRLLLLARPADGVSGAGDVGRRGTTRLPYRSFRFGTGTT